MIVNMFNVLDNVICKGMTIGIDSMIPKFITSVVKIIQIGIPIILVVLGMIDLGKAVTSNDEKQMKEAQKTLIKRCIYAVLVFFIIAIVKFIFGTLGASGGGSDNATNCIDCFLNYKNGKCQYEESGSSTSKSGSSTSKSGSSTSQKSEPQLKFEKSSINKKTTDGAFTNKLNRKTDGNITYKSSNPKVATINGTSGQVIIKGVGKTKITATSAETKKYKKGKATYDITVKK